MAIGAQPQETTATRIRKVRVEILCLTQRELANKLNIEPVNVSRWERGVAEPRLQYLREIARLANVSPSFFFPDEAAA